MAPMFHIWGLGYATWVPIYTAGTLVMRMADADLLPFEFTALLWGALYGWLLWQEFPSTASWIGIGIIVASGLYVLYRERQTGTPTLMRRAGWRRLRRQ